MVAASVAALYLLAACAGGSRMGLHSGGLVAPSAGGKIDDDAFGTCPADNAVCVVIKFRPPKASDNCRAGPLCSGVAARLTTALGPGEDSGFPGGCSRCVELDGPDEESRRKHWAFDVIVPYDEASQTVPSNADTSKAIVHPMVDRAFACDSEGQGCQGSAFFAYGATGSGKSFTMGFNNEFEENAGLMQLGMQEVYARIKDMRAKHSALGGQRVFMVFYELYGTEVKLGSGVIDLLVRKAKPLRGSRESVLRRLSFFEVPDMESLAKVFKKGMANRAVGATGMNAVSSRSHAVVQFFLTNKDMAGAAKAKDLAKVMTFIKTAVVMTFVDLAGSEKPNWEDRARWPNLSDNVRKLRSQEGKVINIGLSMLATCIGKAAGKNVVCSSRSDMLTEMLKGLFEKNKKTGRASIFVRMIATMNPSSDPEQVSLTEGTMRYASVVKKIRISLPKGLTAGTAVTLSPAAQIARLKSKLADLEAELVTVRASAETSQALISELAAVKAIQEGKLRDCEDAALAQPVEEATPISVDEAELACNYSQRAIDLLEQTTGAGTADLAVMFDELDQAREAETDRQQVLEQLRIQHDYTMQRESRFVNRLLSRALGRKQHSKSMEETMAMMEAQGERLARLDKISRAHLADKVGDVAALMRDAAEDAAGHKEVPAATQFGKMMENAAYSIGVIQNQVTSGEASSGTHVALESMLHGALCDAHNQMVRTSGAGCATSSDACA